MLIVQRGDLQIQYKILSLKKKILVFNNINGVINSKTAKYKYSKF